jgi:hypothetical protein
MERYEEDRKVGALWGWAMVFLLTAAIIGWCMFLMMMVEDPPRRWDFGSLPDVPAESIYSTVKAPPAAWYFPFRLRTPPSVTKDVPRQISPLPEGVPWKPPEEISNLKSQISNHGQQGGAP